MHYWSKRAVIGVTLSIIACTPAIAESETHIGLRGAYIDAGTTDTQLDSMSPLFELDYGDGFGVGVNIGRSFGAFRTEIELTYLRVGPNRNLPVPGVEFELRDRYWMGLLGVYYDVSVSSAFTIYLGGGGGVISRNADLVQLTPLPNRAASINGTSFGIFGEVGAAVAVSSSVSIFSAFRYMEHNDGRSTSSNNFWVGVRKRF